MDTVCPVHTLLSALTYSSIPTHLVHPWEPFHPPSSTAGLAITGPCVSQKLYLENSFPSYLMINSPISFKSWLKNHLLSSPHPIRSSFLILSTWLLFYLPHTYRLLTNNLSISFYLLLFTSTSSLLENKLQEGRVCLSILFTDVSQAHKRT